MNWWLHPCNHRPLATDGQCAQGGVKPEDEGGGLCQCNSVIQKENRKSWDYYMERKGERSCVFLLSHKVALSLSANMLLDEKICQHSFLPPPAQVAGLHTSNTNKYHPTSAFFSLCSPGKAVPETKACGSAHRTCSQLFQVWDAEAAWTCCSLSADWHPESLLLPFHLPHASPRCHKPCWTQADQFKHLPLTHGQPQDTAIW